MPEASNCRERSRYQHRQIEESRVIEEIGACVEFLPG